MAITSELALAYLATDFVVHWDGRLIHFPGQGKCQHLGEVLAGHGVDTAAFLTAYNPRSETTSPSENEAMQKELIQQTQKVWKYLEGEGRDPTGQWPSEPSLLILGISLDEARALADQYGQNAFVFVDNSGRSRLIATNLAGQSLIEKALKQQNKRKGHPP